MLPLLLRKERMLTLKQSMCEKKKKVVEKWIKVTKKRRARVDMEKKGRIMEGRYGKEEEKELFVRVGKGIRNR